MSLFVRSPIIAYPRKLHISQYIVGSHFFIPTPSPIHPSLIAVSGSGNFVPSTVSRVEIVACLGLCTLDSRQLNSGIYATGIQSECKRYKCLLSYQWCYHHHHIIDNQVTCVHRTKQNTPMYKTEHAHAHTINDYKAALYTHTWINCLSDFTANFLQFKIFNVIVAICRHFWQILFTWPAPLHLLTPCKNCQRDRDFGNSKVKYCNRI